MYWLGGWVGGWQSHSETQLFPLYNLLIETVTVETASLQTKNTCFYALTLSFIKISAF